MGERTVIQNIYGTVNGNVIGGNMQAPEGAQQSCAAQQPAQHSPQQLRAYIQSSRKQLMAAWVRKYFNLPAAGLLVVLGYGGYRVLGQIKVLKHFDISQAQAIQPSEIAIMAVVSMTLAYWLNSVRREHDMVIAYAQDQIDQAKLALRLRRGWP